MMPILLYFQFLKFLINEQHMEAVEKQCMKVYDEEYMSGKVSGVIKKYVISLILPPHQIDFQISTGFTEYPA
jgi:hypothetical protein